MLLEYEVYIYDKYCAGYFTIFSCTQNIVDNLMTVYATIIAVLILSLQLVTCQLHCSVRIVIVLLY